MQKRNRISAVPERGSGTLVVVMVLFFIMSLVAAYASRNLIFEQRTSANNYRSIQAFEAAQAGLEWAIAMLNGGRINAACGNSIDVANDSFRERYLAINPADGRLSPRKWLNAGVQTDLQPSCVRDGDAWQCSCPAAGDPVLAAPAGNGPSPGFRVSFEANAQPGVVKISVQGCSSFGSECAAGAASRSDAIAQVNALVGLAPTLAQTPAAALTVRGRLTANGALAVTNADRGTNGITINAGDAAVNPAWVLSSLPGTPPQLSVVAGPDLSLNPESAGGLKRGEMMFLATFGTTPDALRVQPAVKRLRCDVNCAQVLKDAADGFPGRVLWIDGNLTIDPNVAPLVIGSAGAPVLLVVEGDILVGPASTFTINGLLYARGASLTATDSSTTVNGAVIAEGVRTEDADDGSFNIVGAPAFILDTDVIATLKEAHNRHSLDFGSMALVPGSWRDFR